MKRPSFACAAARLLVLLVGAAGCAAPARVAAPPAARSAAPAPPAAVRPPLPQAVLDTLAARLGRGRYVGVAVGVLDASGRAVYGFGRQGQESTATPVDGGTLFEIGSVTKTMTGLLLADAVGRGAATLGTPLRALLPDTLDLAPGVGALTLRQLTTHTSGLPRLPSNLVHPSFSMDDPYAAYDVPRLYAALRTVLVEAARFDTSAHALALREGGGARQRAVDYSNLGAGLLGHVLARQAGRTYEALLAERVLRPLGMEAFVAVPQAFAGRVATGHTLQGTATPPWTFTDALVGAGGVRASADALLTYLAAQLQPAGPLAQTVRRSHTVLAADGARRGVAYGWFTQALPSGAPVFWHNGGTGGFAAFVAFVPSQGRAVVVLSNVAGPVDDLGQMLLR